MKWMIAAILLLALPPAAVGAGDIDRLRNYYSRAGFQWVASHESADFSEYFWRHADTACGWLDVVPDPTASGRWYVSESQIYCALGNGQVHPKQIFPVFYVAVCGQADPAPFFGRRRRQPDVKRGIIATVQALFKIEGGIQPVNPLLARRTKNLALGNIPAP